MTYLKPKTILIIIIAGFGIGALFSLIGNQDKTGNSKNVIINPEGLEKNMSPPIVNREKIHEARETQSEYIPNINDDVIDQTMAFSAIDLIAAHPDDPQTPKGVDGVTDDELIKTPSEEIEQLIELALPYAENNSKEPRYLFALGRAAYIHGDDELAFELLKKASNYGSPAADAYLGLLLEDKDKKESDKYLQSAINGGFNPAKGWLESESEITPNIQYSYNTPIHTKSSVDYNLFYLPSFIKSLHDGTSKQYANEPLLPLLYINSINDELSNLSQSSYYLDLEDQNILKLISEIDPNLSFYAARKVATNQVAMGQVLDGAMEVFMNIGEAYKKGPTREGISEMNRALLGQSTGKNEEEDMITVHEVKGAGIRDARILFKLFKHYPDDVLKIYQGMKRFVIKEVH